MDYTRYMPDGDYTATIEATIELMENLCKIPSPSGKEDRLIEFITEFLAEYGYEARIADGNLIVNSQSEFFVTTHLDSVGEPSFNFDGKFFYGNSVCDAKASIAAILMSLSKIKPEDINFGIALLSDEEAGGTGSKRFTAKYKPKAAVVMEPTSLKIANIHYGNLEVEIVTKTSKAHGSMHEKANAIELCLQVIGKIKASCSIKPAILSIEGGSDDYVIPSRCRATLDFLIPPTHKSSEILDQLSKIISSSNSNSAVEFKILELCDPFESVVVHQILAKALESSGIEVDFSEMRSWTDGVNLKTTADVVVWGPGDLEFCHTEREKVDIEEILKASDVLINLNHLLKNENVF
ncbi:MAG: M20/M25/M40 family metallo-hydrolase [Archaeoglobus sp.]|nr:M20/M25/M40 family metallo-hydrolase [Archaeoglobus sp.]